MSLIMADDTVIENGKAGYSKGFLWCYIQGFTMAQAAQIFLDTEKTETIRFEYGEMADEYTGFTECKTIRIDEDGQISVCMTKPKESGVE